MFTEILNAIKEYDRIIIHRHSNPDGDAIGSQVGLKNIIKARFPEKQVFAVGDSAGRYSFIEDSAQDELSDADFDGALSIILDTSASALISDSRYSLAKKTVRMDHHIFCEKIADTEFVDTSYESCCGLVTDFARTMELEIPSVAAKALYTGMVTDSGRFRYESTSSKTHALASHLLKTPFSTQDIFTNLYSDELSRIKLRASFVLKIQTTEHRVAYIYTTRDEAIATGADNFTLSRGMVNTMAEIRGIDSWVNFTETENGVLCEIRSSKYNINSIAVKYGGGGHKAASGATLKDRDEAMRLLSELCALNQSEG
ncbi:MAG: bifunctional oligoribonuclease/PAP phosphatase NrnA [Clostridia bacterium]|nr:bifunctional oligoribonuclease/PAP phosphatase NrnA [Clostridia bacterium]